MTTTNPTTDELQRITAVLPRDAGLHWINKGEYMKPNEIACSLEMWRGRREALDAQLDALDAVLKTTPENPLREAIEGIWMGYTVAMSQLIGDKAEWLQWYWLERQMGNKPGDVHPAEGAAKITVTRDVLTLANVIAWGQQPDRVAELERKLADAHTSARLGLGVLDETHRRQRTAEANCAAMRAQRDALAEVAQYILVDDFIQYLPDEYVARVRAALAAVRDPDDGQGA